jgi:cation transport ATPase
VTNIDAKEAASALSDIEQIVHRVRQSTIYNLASLMLIWWGALILVGNIATYLWPRNGGYIWIAVNVVGLAGTFAIGAYNSRRRNARGFDFRMVAAIVLFFAFGILWSIMLGHFTPRQLGVFWPTYFMMIYTIVGLWVGAAFAAIGLGITALTLIGYFFVGAWFDLWMAVVNGGGLMLGGLWMRRS